jgi:hypothetical protein
MFEFSCFLLTAQVVFIPKEKERKHSIIMAGLSWEAMLKFAIHRMGKGFEMPGRALLLQSLLFVLK